MSDSAPARKLRNVTPSDTVALAPDCRALYVGGAGNVVISCEAGDQCTFVGVQAGTVLPIRARLVYSTDTTATNIIALY